MIVSENQLSIQLKLDRGTITRRRLAGVLKPNQIIQVGTKTFYYYILEEAKKVLVDKKRLR